MSKDQAFQYDFEELLLKKDFALLSHDEESFVLTLISGEEEYQSMRQTLLAVQREMRSGTSLKPKPEIKDALMARMAGGSDKKVIPIQGRESSGKGSAFKWWIPAGIAAAVIFGWMLIFNQNEIPVGQLAEKVERTQTAESPRETEDLAEETDEAPAVENEDVPESFADVPEDAQEETTGLIDPYLAHTPAEDLIEPEIEKAEVKTATKQVLAESAVTEMNADQGEVTFNAAESLSSAPTMSAITTDQFTFLDLSPVSATSHADMFGYLYTAW